jgi:hypothetical protein
MIKQKSTANALQAKGANPRRVHFNVGSAKDSSGASFGQELRAWYSTQKLFATQAAFAESIGASPEALQLWMRSASFPGEPLCDKLFEITQLGCFSLRGRVTARREHEEKKGLSRAAIKKREEREYLKPEELAACIADPDLAFTIRGDEWIVCLECGQLLTCIRFRGRGVHHCCGKTEEQYRAGRYGPNVKLVSRAYASERRKAKTAQNLRADAGLANLRPREKGAKMPPEQLRSQSRRMTGARNPESHFSKNISSIDYIWPWLFEGKSLDAIADVLKITYGGVWAGLERVLGKPVRNRVTREDATHAPRAMEITHRCGDNEAKLRTEVAELCSESSKTRNSDRIARTVLLWMPRAIEWLRRNPTRAQAMSGADLGRVFEAEVLPKLKLKEGRKPGPDKTPVEKTAEAEIGRQVEELIGKGKSVEEARKRVHAKFPTCEYGTIASYHQRHRRRIRRRTSHPG